MSEVLTRFQEFLADPEAPDMYITGVAGTGKTTCLGEVLQYCIDARIKAVTCAFTHRACTILSSKLPKAAVVCTLHSFLKKRPTVNDRATKLQHVDKNTQTGIPDRVKVLFVDEFSMVGERDHVDVKAMQYDDDANIVMKVIYVGDPNQLPPVKDMRAITPRGKHWVKLTKVHRQANDNPLLDTLIRLNSYIDGATPEPLQEHETFTRGQDVERLYAECRTSKVLLAYTNERVQTLNASVQGRDAPELGDALFSPTTRASYVLEDLPAEVNNVVGPRGELVELGSKYKTLETLQEMDGVQFMTLADERGNIANYAVVFGHSSHLCMQQSLAKRAVFVNSEIKRQFNVDDATTWARANSSHDLARRRSRAWRHYLAFKENVLCVDFTHAMTVHKSQGSTYETVFLDVEDMGKCAKNDYQLYLKLMYVAISRASKRVYTN